jgi:hypothetical protein
VAPQCWRHNAYRFKEAPDHAQNPDLQRQGKLKRRTAPIFDDTPFSVGDVEEGLDLKISKACAF